MNLTPNRVRDRMTLGQATTDPNVGAMTLSDLSSSPYFVAGVTILGVAWLMSVVDVGSSVKRTFRSSAKKRERKRMRIRQLEDELRSERSA